MSANALWEVDSDLFAPPIAAMPNDHSPDWDATYRKLRAQRKRQFQQQVDLADPDELLPRAKKRREKIDAYLSGEINKKKKGDPSQLLPEDSDFRALADTFGAQPETLEQAEHMAAHRGLWSKSKRFLLCGRLGHRVNCRADHAHAFFVSFRCRCRYCQSCGPLEFRKKFAKYSVGLAPVVDALLQGAKDRGRLGVVAKLDFLIRNDRVMPRSAKIREFHDEMRNFWRFAERLFAIGRKEYGHAGCDEFGGNNTNLHRHSVYVGPFLPQKECQLSALWSIAGLRGERRRDLLHFVRTHGRKRCFGCGVRHCKGEPVDYVRALACAWRNALADHEKRFVSIKIANNFAEALGHALKYPAKFIEQSTPQRLAQLEFAFHRTRQFSTGGAFYKAVPNREPGEDSPVGECPKCHAPLCETVEPWVSVFVLESEGRADVERVRRDEGRAKIFSG